MYFLGKEHNPPHVHAQYRDNAAEFDINGRNPFRISSR
ncbi:MAG: DUF4160 domain-containing protein [Sphaerochaeta sp.]|nr:DUF4160 domain-containing protein [Sphaerochaeta sp.]